MLRNLLLVAVLSAAPPFGAAPADRELSACSLVDLSVGAADAPALDGQGGPALADLRFCRWDDAPGRNLLGTVRAGAVILSRNRPAAGPTARIFRSGDEAVLLDAADLDLGTAAGLDLTLLTAFGRYHELEIRYFGIDGWHTSRSAGDPASVRFDGFGLSFAGLSQRVEYASRLYNIEVNYRPRVTEGIPLILGFRSLQLHEWLELRRLDPLPEAIGLHARVNNFLYGFQIGAEPYLLGNDSSPLRVDGLLKAGIYGNCASQSAFAPPWGASLDARGTRAAFVGEIGLSLDYCFSKFFAVRAGYELLWIHGVALAPDQSPATRLLLPSAGVNDSATAFYQGAVVSLEFLF